MSSCSIWWSHGVGLKRNPLTSQNPVTCGTIVHGALPTFVFPNVIIIGFFNRRNMGGQKVLFFLLRQNGPLGAMSREIELNTLQGSVITLDVPITATVRELKMMLLENHPCQDPIERKVFKVELLHSSSIIDDAETLNSGMFLGAESPVTVTYTRNEVEAAEQDDIRTEGYVGVKIPSNVTNISNAAFKDLHELVLVTIPESVTHIGECAFQHCDSLASITLGESVADIGEGAFAGCTSLASITLGESVTNIGDEALAGCTSLASITLDESVTHIGECAFQHCDSLASITLGESVADIGEGAFAGCTSLASITLGESVTNIGDEAFAGCTSLASITLGESVTHIGQYAFARCSSLASITLPESLRHILEGVFRDSSVAIITIPAKQGRKRLRNEWMSVQNLLWAVGFWDLVKKEAPKMKELWRNQVQPKFHFLYKKWCKMKQNIGCVLNAKFWASYFSTLTRSPSGGCSCHLAIRCCKHPCETKTLHLNRWNFLNIQTKIYD